MHFRIWRIQCRLHRGLLVLIGHQLLQLSLLLELRSLVGSCVGIACIVCKSLRLLQPLLVLEERSSVYGLELLLEQRGLRLRRLFPGLGLGHRELYR